MYAVYDQLYRAIRETYTTRTAMEEIRQINALFCGKENTSYATQAASGSVLGVPGIGKTSTIRRALETMPQVIEHTEYMGQPFYCKQVLYLRIACPSDCSVKTLALNLLSALDRAIGSDYLHQLISLRSIAASAVATQVKILCMTHHVGLLLVDEIQNAVETAQRNRQIKPLLKFLVELTNDTATAVYFVGTPAAEQLFTSQEHLKRRTRGIRLLPLKPDGTYRRFLEQLWPFQLTPQQAPLRACLTSPRARLGGIFSALTALKNPCNPSGFCNRRIERLCRIIVHDPSMGSLHDMDFCGFLPCRAKNLSRQSVHAEILNRLSGGKVGVSGAAWSIGSPLMSSPAG